MLSFKTTRIVSLILRILIFIALLSSLVIVSINKLEYLSGLDPKSFTYFVGLRYVFATCFIGAAYAIGQGVRSIIHMAKGSEGNAAFDFYAEEVMLNFIASGAVAGFIAAADVQKEFIAFFRDDDFLNMTFIASGLVMFAYLCSFALSVFSSYELGRQDDCY
ncbi:hypothetical protein ACLB2K_069815 [Fragaria x ananassa]|uniref:CASP-like protein 4D1 n=1 Tax=Fragaria vesca subsp. vesca TaxID=101020 RepID=UPI0005CB1E61|nr:PREDICTED: CASP-like protein 4D1 [Fragaria vesca subsp. vesca]